MSRRRSSVLLPFTAANSTVIGSKSITHQNVSIMRNGKTPANRRRTQVEAPREEHDKDALEMFEGKQVMSVECPAGNNVCLGPMSSQISKGRAGMCTECLIY